jgi:hypothetical protein
MGLDEAKTRHCKLANRLGDAAEFLHARTLRQILLKILRHIILKVTTLGWLRSLLDYVAEMRLRALVYDSNRLSY